MSEIIIYGLPPSSYVRTARMAAWEKGVSHELQPIDLGSAEHEKIHPFKKMPVLKHGDFVLGETLAITRYIDDNFDGPNLLPNDARGRAQAEQWISYLDCYMYKHFIKDYAFEYIFPKGDGGPSKDNIQKAMPNLERGLGLLNDAIGEKDWIVGKELTLADLFYIPVLATLGNFPEGKAALGKNKGVAAMFERAMGRESFQNAHKDLVRHGTTS